MTLKEQFEIEYQKQPSEPFTESENPEQWARCYDWQQEYIDWLEYKLEVIKGVFTY